MEEDLETNLDVVGLDGHYAANTYSPLPVAAATADGSWITDVEGNRYLDYAVGLFGDELRPSQSAAD